VKMWPKMTTDVPVFLYLTSLYFCLKLWLRPITCKHVISEVSSQFHRFYGATAGRYENVYVAVDCCNDLLADGGGHKEKTYFWQYNMQSKGPKGKRLCRVVNDDDPYVLHDFEDPVFDSELLVNIHIYLLGALFTIW